MLYLYIMYFIFQLYMEILAAMILIDIYNNNIYLVSPGQNASEQNVTKFTR